MAALRIGHGYDVHQLRKGRRFLLAGVSIPYIRGLDGHSDADVLCHAVMDAVLGALALGDIGRHFPDSDPIYQDADSMVLLMQCIGMMRERGYQLGNLDATVIAQAPRLAPYIPQMRDNLAAVFTTDPENINVKATTEENMGFTGAGEGVAVHCVCLLEKKN